MLIDVALAGLGLVILLLAGDALVRGAVNLALRLGVPALLVSLTVVAFGTSAPELLVSVSAVLDDAPGLALGNVVGSNIANILLVLGVPAILSGIDAGASDTRRTYVIMIAGSVLFIALAMTGVFALWQGLVLLAGLALMLTDAGRSARQHRADSAALPPEVEPPEGADDAMPGWKVAVYLLLGLIGLPLGAQILIDAAIGIATALEVPETVIGLTLVAIGTSLPELATSVMAALRRQADVALGNVIGSNVFNLLAIIGIASLVGPIPVDPQMLRLDLWVMLGTSLLLGPFVLRGLVIGRLWGGVFLGAYALYLLAVVA